MSHTGAITALASGSYQLSRRATGSTVNGIYTPGAAAISTITASVQPVGIGRRGGALAKSLPEGRSAEDVRTVYTLTELRAAPIPDLLTIEGVLYEVFHVARWDGLGQTYYQALAGRVVRQ